MSRGGLSDLDELVLRCRNPRARSYIEEAITCLKAGAFRAAIVATWIAVVHDLIEKLEYLECTGDPNARVKLDEFRSAASEQRVVKLESTILVDAHKQFEFFGALALKDLERLQDDRHRCAHPSMFDPETDYQPPAELARCHIVNAVTHLLEHEAAQGKSAFEWLQRRLEQDYFPETVEDVVALLKEGHSVARGLRSCAAASQRC